MKLKDKQKRKKKAVSYKLCKIINSNNNIME
eukprot:UN11213